MAGKTRQADGRMTIPAGIVLCLFAIVAPSDLARAEIPESGLAIYLSSVDPGEILLGGIVACAFLVSIALCILSALRQVKRSVLRRTAFVCSALNTLH